MRRVVLCMMASVGLVGAAGGATLTAMFAVYLGPGAVVALGGAILMSAAALYWMEIFK